MFAPMRAIVSCASGRAPARSGGSPPSMPIALAKMPIAAPKPCSA